jgi:hypothetical protein
MRVTVHYGSAGQVDPKRAGNNLNPLLKRSHALIEVYADEAIDAP